MELSQYPLYLPSLWTTPQSFVPYTLPIPAGCAGPEGSSYI
jgi:hypothetical protein